MSQFKDSSYITNNTAAGFMLASALSAKTAVDVTRGASGAAGAMTGSMLRSFGRDATVPYSIGLLAMLGFTIYGVWDAVFGYGSLSDRQMAVAFVALLCANAMWSILEDLRQICRGGDKVFAVGYGPAWGGYTALAFITLYFTHGLIGLNTLSPEMILVGGFIMFNIMPKVVYLLSRDTQASAFIQRGLYINFGDRFARNDAFTKESVRVIWNDLKESNITRSIWAPSELAFITIPMMLVIFFRG